MTMLSNLLREADPLIGESRRNDEARRLRRQRILDTPPVADTGRRALVTAALVGLALVGIAVGGRYWTRLSMDAVAAVRFEVRLAEENPADGLREAVVSAAGRRIYLHQETVVTNSDITEARLTSGETASTFNVIVTFNAEGAAKMLRATEGHIGRPMAILIDGDVVMAPVVRGAITTSAIISGNYPRAEAERIVAGIVGR